MYRGLFITICLTIVMTAMAYAGPLPQRIVSLAPSVTEMLFALGVGDRVVGVTDFCNYPPEARQKPKMGGMSNPSLEAVVSARPDLVVLTTDGNPKEFELRLEKLGIRTHVMTERRMEELPAAIRSMGRLVGAEERAERLAVDAEKRLKKFRSMHRPRGRSLFVVWPEPLMAAGPGTAIDDAMKMLGFENIAVDADTAYPKFSLEVAIRRAPEYIFIGNGMGMDMREVSEASLERLSNTPAARNGHIYFMSDDLFRFGLRMLDGMDEMVRLTEEDDGAR
jgi:iron complex transport system substrate-binding protein